MWVHWECPSAAPQLKEEGFLTGGQSRLSPTPDSRALAQWEQVPHQKQTLSGDLGHLITPEMSFTCFSKKTQQQPTDKFPYNPSELGTAPVTPNPREAEKNPKAPRDVEGHGQNSSYSRVQQEQTPQCGGSQAPCSTGSLPKQVVGALLTTLSFS